MFLLKRITVVFFAVFFAAGAFALETATVRTTLPNGKVETREIKLREVEKNVFRAEIPATPSI